MPNIPRHSEAPHSSHEDTPSMRRRYEQFREREIEYYKQVIPHRTLMRIADAARVRLHMRGELALGELTLAFEVDDIIAERMALPSFRSWSRANQLSSATHRSPASGATQLLMAIAPSTTIARDALLVQPRQHDAWELLCADGRSIVIVEPDRGAREMIGERACEQSWSEQVETVAQFSDVATNRTFNSVHYSPAACADYGEWEAESFIDTLQAMTVRGGVHVVDGLLTERNILPRSMLRRGYASWSVRARRGRKDWTLIAQHTA